MYGYVLFFFFQAEDGIRDAQESRGLGDVYKRQVINHADDKVIIVDASIAPLLARVRDQLPNVQHIIVKGPGDASSLGPDILDYDALLAAEPVSYTHLTLPTIYPV